MTKSAGARRPGAAGLEMYVVVLTQMRTALAREEPVDAPLSDLHVGRGGSGNVRSPSRDPVDRQRMAEELAKSEEEAQHARLAQVPVTGRGGDGNVGFRGRSSTKQANPSLSRVLRSISRSRSRSREPRALSFKE